MSRVFLISPSQITHTLHPISPSRFAPVGREIDASALEVIEGRIPEELSGAYIRNGPNPRYEPVSYNYPLEGDGMLHAVRFSGGRASYHNRYVRTRSFEIIEKGRPIDKGGGYLSQTVALSATVTSEPAFKMFGNQSITLFSLFSEGFRHFLSPPLGTHVGIYQKNRSNPSWMTNSKRKGKQTTKTITHNMNRLLNLEVIQETDNILQ